MATETVEPQIRFEPDEPCPPFVALIVGLQGAVIVLAPTVLIIALSLSASGLADSYLTWGVFAGLLINAAITALQAFRIGRFGGGHVGIAGPTAQFIGITVVAVSEAGPHTLASLLIVCSVIQVAMAWWLPTLRRVLTPVVSGTVMILISVTVLPLVLDNVQDLPEGSSPGAGPAIAGTTLFASVLTTLGARGRWRAIAPLISIAAGCAIAAGLGVIDGQRIASADWFGIPDLPPLGVDLTPGKEFWALLPTFVILTLVLGLKTITDSVLIQQASWRRPRATDFRQVQGMINVNGVGMLLAGIAGTPPLHVYSGVSASLISVTGVAARRVGIGAALVFVVLAFFSKFTAVLLSIPVPVMAAYLMLIFGLFFVGGVQAIVRDGLDQKRTLTVAVALTLGLGLHGHPVMQDVLGDELGSLFGNGVMIGSVTAIAMSLLFETLTARRSRLEVTLEMDSLPAINDFLMQLAERLGWNEASTRRLRSAGEETLASLLTRDEDDEQDVARLIVAARPESAMVELEFIATTRSENLEDQLAYLGEESPIPSADDLSLRLLGLHASGVRHQKFHGVDIVTVRVEGSN